MNFMELLLAAKEDEQFAIDKLMDMYKPLLLKSAIIDGCFDEDLYHELVVTFLRCIKKIKIIK